MTVLEIYDKLGLDHPKVFAEQKRLPNGRRSGRTTLVLAKAICAVTSGLTTQIKYLRFEMAEYGFRRLETMSRELFGSSIMRTSYKFRSSRSEWVLASRIAGLPSADVILCDIDPTLLESSALWTLQGRPL